MSIADKLQIDYDEFLSALQSCMGYVEGSVLQVGQSVCLPPYTPACRFVSDSGECTRYTVQYGDSLSIVANSFNIDMEELANVNNLNLTTPVRPNTRLVLPPVGKGCSGAASASSTSSDSSASTASTGASEAQSNPSPTLNPSPPQKDIADSKCKMWLSSGGETIASIAEANNVDIGELKRANGNKYPKSTDVTEPGAFVYLPPFDSKCKEEDVVVVNRPAGSQVKVPVGGSSTTTNPVTVAVPPSASPEETAETAETAESPSPSTDEDVPALSPGIAPGNITQDDSINRMVVDVFIKNMDEVMFKEREYIFRENMAYAANISVIDVDVRFSLTVSSLNTRKLLESTPEYLKVNTALFGDETSIYNALTTSIDLGVFPEMMDADGFNISYVTAMYPDKVTLYDASTDPQTVEEAITASEAFYAPLSMWAFIGICVGGGVAAILLVGGLCYCTSRRRRRAAEKKLVESKAQRQKEASKYRKIIQEGGTMGMGGAGKASLNSKTPRPNEIRIDAFSSSMGAERLPSVNGAREASVAPVGDREVSNKSFTSYLMEAQAETPRYSTATPRRDDNSMGQELTRRSSSVTETAREMARETGREAIITPRLPPGPPVATPRSASNRDQRTDRITPRGSSFSNTSNREYSPTRRVVTGAAGTTGKAGMGSSTPRSASFTGSPRRSARYAEF